VSPLSPRIFNVKPRKEGKCIYLYTNVDGIELCMQGIFGCKDCYRPTECFEHQVDEEEGKGLSE